MAVFYRYYRILVKKFLSPKLKKLTPLTTTSEAKNKIQFVSIISIHNVTTTSTKCKEQRLSTLPCQRSQWLCSANYTVYKWNPTQDPSK